MGTCCCRCLQPAVSSTNACCDPCQLRAPQSSCRTSWRAQPSSGASQRYTYAGKSLLLLSVPITCTVSWQRRRLTSAAGSCSACLQNGRHVPAASAENWQRCTASMGVLLRCAGGGRGEGAAGRPAVKALCRRRRGRRILQVRQQKRNSDHVRHRPIMNHGQRLLHTAGLSASYIGYTAIDGTSTPTCST